MRPQQYKMIVLLFLVGVVCSGHSDEKLVKILLEKINMSKYTIIAADGTRHIIEAESKEAACVRYEVCSGYPYMATCIIDRSGKKEALRYGHIVTPENRKEKMETGICCGICINVYGMDETGISCDYYLILHEANVLCDSEVDAIKEILTDGIINNRSQKDIEKALDAQHFKSLVFGYYLLQKH